MFFRLNGKLAIRTVSGQNNNNEKKCILVFALNRVLNQISVQEEYQVFTNRFENFLPMDADDVAL